jgi:hypothetical protein
VAVENVRKCCIAIAIIYLPLDGNVISLVSYQNSIFFIAIFNESLKLSVACSGSLEGNWELNDISE